jgi:hypothetical protein
MRQVQLALSCVLWGDLLETVNALRYLKGILLLYVRNLAEATVMKVLFGLEDVLMEGIPVGCWGLSLSLCSSR